MGGKGSAMLPESNLFHYLADLEDPRIEKNRDHPLINVLVIAILGVICGADNFTEIERFGWAKAEWLKNFLDLDNGIPSHDTFGRVFRWLDEAAFQAAFLKWTQSLCQVSEGEIIALDGKKLRGSEEKTQKRPGIWMVSAWAKENRMVLGQKRVDEKSNEITAMPELLSRLDITGCVVTVDALNTQTKLAEAIVAAQADYIFAVKGNHRTLHEDLHLLFEGFEQDEYRQVLFETAKSISQVHGRDEIRQVFVVKEAEYRDYLRRAGEWKHLKSLVKLITVRKSPHKTEVSTRYFISSWQASAADFLKAIRDHWQIENGLHWVLDIAFREDASRIRKNHAPHNIAVVRHIALNLLKFERSSKVGIAAKRKMAGWNNDYLLNVLCSSCIEV
jgi:predicted transposase YbfD/YdcC